MALRCKSHPIILSKLCNVGSRDNKPSATFLVLLNGLSVTTQKELFRSINMPPRLRYCSNSLHFQYTLVHFRSTGSAP